MTRIAVKSLPVDPGPAGWNCLLPDPPPPSPLNTNLTADWVVIGAGFAGLAAARRLHARRPNDRIVVLEAKRLASGPAGRNSGFMIDLPHDLASADYGGALDRDKALTTDNRLAIDFAAKMASDFALSPEAFSRSGKINAAATQSGHQHNLDHAGHLAAMDEPHRLLDAAQMRAITGTTYYQSGLQTEGTAMIQPALFVRGVGAGLQTLGIDIFEDSPVTALSKVGTGWAVQTPQGTVRAGGVILAVNGHLNSFGFARNRLLHIFTYASMSRALTPDESRSLAGDPTWGVTPADPMGTTVRRINGIGGDRIVIRNRFTCDPSMTVPANRLTRVGQDHDTAFAARFPMLPDVSMEYRWGGRLCVSRNNVNIVRQLEPGLFAACCQNGLGTTRGTLSGMLAADLATDTPSDALHRALAAPEPARLPPAPITKLGANLHLRRQERKAGREL